MTIGEFIDEVRDISGQFGLELGNVAFLSDDMIVAWNDPRDPDDHVSIAVDYCSVDAGHVSPWEGVVQAHDILCQRREMSICN